MPTNNQVITVHKETSGFQYQYQQFEVTTEMLLEVPQAWEGVPHLRVGFDIKQVRAANGPGARIEVETDEPFLEDIHMPSQYLGEVISGNYGQVRAGLANVLRGIIMYDIENLLNLNWGRYADARAGGAVPNQNTLRFADYLAGDNSVALRNKVLEGFVTAVNNMLDGIPCPDGLVGCLIFHPYLPSEQHIEVPEGLLPEGGAVPTELHSEVAPGLRIWWGAQNAGNRTRNQRQILELYGIAQCPACGEFGYPEDMMDNWCEDCHYNSTNCDGCGLRINLDGSFQVEDEIGDLEAAYCGSCWSTRENTSRRLILLSYSYKPDPEFRPAPNPNTNELYMGMEIEVATVGAGYAKINKWINGLNDLFYVKSDSSVDYGMEVVTHPFTYEWAENYFPYEVFDDLLKIPEVLASHPSAGTHVHLSKRAFSTSHLWKFMLFHLENTKFVGLVGGRGDSAGYGSLTSADARNLRRNITQAAKEKGTFNLPTAVSRSSGINLQPENSIELRYFAGDATPVGIQKNQQWVQCVYDFTQEVKAADALKGALGDPGYFLGYLEDQDYPELQEFIEQLLPSPKKLERTY